MFSSTVSANGAQRLILTVFSCRRIRLATNLYSEHLLDRDHYLDWVISGLENSAQARLPMWILIAQIYWVDLLRSRKYGLRLVSAVLSHVHIVGFPQLRRRCGISG